MTRPPDGDMPVEEFRANGHALVDWIADYLDWSLREPVLPRIAPGQIRDALPDAAPEQGIDFTQALDDFEHILVPGLTQWNHPRYFAYFPCGFSSPGVLADFLSTAVSQQAMLWRTSPAATELEEVTLAWLRQAVGLPDEFQGVIYDTASTAIVHALAAARHARAPDIRTTGLTARCAAFRVYCSEHAHSSMDKAMITLGLGHENLVRIPCDASFAMRADALDAAIARDRSAEHEPLAIIATIGTTAAASIDPVSVIAAIAQREHLWLHVDAAYAGSAAILPECRRQFAGTERADSFVMNPHKWLFTPFDLSVLYCRNIDTLRAAFALTPDYLATPEASDVRNLMDTGFQLGRRFRSLKLWFVMRYFGLEGLRARLREHLRLAYLFAGWIDTDPAFERMAPVSFGVVCFRAIPPSSTRDADVDRFNEQLLHALNESGDAFLSHARLSDRYVLRLAIGNIRTTEADLTLVWQRLRELATEAAPASR